MARVSWTSRAVTLVALAVMLGAGGPMVGDAEASPQQGADVDSERRGEAIGKPEAKGSLVAVVRGFRNRRGQLLLAVFDSEEGFPNDVKHALFQKAYPIEKDPLVVKIPGLDPGLYAVAIHHDEDGDFEMDKSFFGIPQEGYGASRDAPARFGPPRFKHARFQLEKGQQLELPIQVRYF